MPEPRKVQVEGHFLDDDDQNLEVSGIACSTSPGEAMRTCLIALDEGLAAQWATLTLGPDPKLTVGAAVPLFDVSANTPELRAGIPPVACAGGTGEFNEHDSEGVAFAGDHFFLTGSHGCGRNSSKFKASSFIDVRLAAMDGAEPPVLTTLLNTALANLPALTAAFGKDIADGSGISIEGIAASDDTLFFGLRSPVLDDGAPIVAVDAAALFAGGDAPGGILYNAKLDGMGVRDLAVLGTDPLQLLVLAGPSAGEGGAFAVFLFTPHEGNGSETTVPVAALSVPDGEKAEGLLVAARDGNKVKALILHDGVEDGDPTLYDLTLP